MKLEKFTHHEQPYGKKVLADCTATPITAEKYGDEPHVRHCEAEGLFEVVGTVVEGGDVSRLCGHTHFQSKVGRKHWVWAVSRQDLEAGYKITVAM